VRGRLGYPPAVVEEALVGAGHGERVGEYGDVIDTEKLVAKGAGEPGVES